MKFTKNDKQAIVDYLDSKGLPTNNLRVVKRIGRSTPNIQNGQIGIKIRPFGHGGDYSFYYIVKGKFNKRTVKGVYAGYGTSNYTTLTTW